MENLHIKRGVKLLLLLPVFMLPLFAAFLVAGRGAGAASGGVAVRWGFYVTYNSNSLQSLQSNVHNLTHVSPWFYNLTANGTVSGNDQASVSSLIKNAGVKELPMIKNTSAEYNDFTALVSNPAKVASIVDQIDALVTNNNYDGITLDFEAVNPTDKTNLTILMSRIYDRLHPKGKITVAIVAAKTRDIDTGWAAPYDYSALGRVVDYVMVMAYDFSYVGGSPGAIAPMNKLRDTATYTLAHIAANQVIWAVGVYGYDWPVGSDGRPIRNADARTWAEADTLAHTANAQSGYDTSADAPWARYTDPATNTAHVLWYEDKRSFDEKMDLVTGRGMAGFALWRLGQEDPTIWNTIATLPTVIPTTPTPPSFPTNPQGTTPPNATATLPAATATATATHVPPTATNTSTPTPIPTPVACNPVAPVDTTNTLIYFPETKHTLKGAFLSYWKQNGALPVYGFPITEEFTEKSPTDGKTYTVQYFERNRFEYHPENAAPNNVQLGLLGVQETISRTFPPASDIETGPDAVYFPQIGHTVSGAFLGYWQGLGALRQFGYPISEPVLEQNPTDGKTYSVQYFERARFELHPENAGSQYEVLLGLLGLNVSPCK